MTGKVVFINISARKSIRKKPASNAIEKIKGDTSDCGSSNH